MLKQKKKINQTPRGIILRLKPVKRLLDSPTAGTRQTWALNAVIRLESKHLHQLSYPVGPSFYILYLECVCVHTCTHLCIKIHVWNTQGTTLSAVHHEGPRDRTQVMSLVTSAQYAEPS